MTKTFKLGTIFLVTVINLQIFRMIFAVINLSDNLSSWLFSLLFQVLIMGVLPYLMFRFWVNKDTRVYLNDMRLNVKIHPLSYLLALGIGLLVFFLNTTISSIWYNFLTKIGYTYIAGVGTIYSSWEVLLFEIITSAMLPAIFEELTDRGLLLAALENVSSDKYKILIVGVFFGLLHQNIAQFAPTIFGGLIMAYLAIKGRSILPAMIVHFMNNFMIIMVNFSSQKNGFFIYCYNKFYQFYASNFIIALAISILSVCLLTWGLSYFAKINKPQREKAEPPKVPLAKIGKVLKTMVNSKAAPTIKHLDQQTDDFYDIYKLGDISNDKPSEPILSVIIENEPTANNSSSDCEQDKGTTEIPATELLLTPQAQAVIAQKVLEQIQNEQKTKWWEYGMLYVSAFTALIATVFTLIWGLLR